MIKKMLKRLGYVKESEIFVDITEKIKYRQHKKYYLFTWKNKRYLLTNHALIVASLRAKKHSGEIL